MWGALLASTAMSGFGICSAFWDGMAAHNPAAFAGFGIIAAAFAACEIGAVSVAFAITKDGATLARGALFAFCTIANVLAGHFGADAINTRLVAPQRAPYEAALDGAKALVEAATNSQAEFTSRAASERAELETAINAERSAAAGAVTARGIQAQEQRNALQTRQDAQREAIKADLDAATHAKAEAEANLEKAPKGFDLIQQWALAALLESLKGVLIWVAAPRRRKLAAGTVAQIAPADARALSDADLEAAWESLGEARTTSAVIWHERRRRNRAA
jgi:hypothetical protein